MVTCTKCRSSDIRVYYETRNDVIYAFYVCNLDGFGFGAS